MYRRIACRDTVVTDIPNPPSQPYSLQSTIQVLKTFDIFRQNLQRNLQLIKFSKAATGAIKNEDRASPLGCLYQQLHDLTPSAEEQVEGDAPAINELLELIQNILTTVQMLHLILGDPAYDNPNAFLPYNLATLTAKVFPFMLGLHAISSGGLTGLAELMKILPDGATAARVEDPALFTFATGASLVAGLIQAAKMGEGVVVTSRSEQTLRNMAGDMTALLNTLAARKINAGASAFAGGVQTLAGCVSVAITAMGNHGDIDAFCSGAKSFDDAGLTPGPITKANLSLAILYQVFINITLTQSTIQQFRGYASFQPLTQNQFKITDEAWDSFIPDFGLLNHLMQEALGVSSTETNPLSVGEFVTAVNRVTNGFKAQGDRNKKGSIAATALYGVSTYIGSLILGTSAYYMATDNGEAYLKNAACKGELPPYFPAAFFLYFGIGGIAHILAGFTGANPLGYAKQDDTDTPSLWSRFCRLPVISQLQSGARYAGKTVAHATRLDTLMPSSVSDQQRMLITAFIIMVIAK
ncbi:MAG: hypothetical protein O3A01_08305 [bacterium]|nr:hypothetical protein [bacterium]